MTLLFGEVTGTVVLDLDVAPFLHSCRVGPARQVLEHHALEALERRCFETKCSQPHPQPNCAGVSAARSSGARRSASATGRELLLPLLARRAAPRRILALLPRKEGSCLFVQ